MHAKECAKLLNGFIAVEKILEQDSKKFYRDDNNDELDYMASLERVAHATLHLMQQLQSSSDQVTAALTTPQRKDHDGKGNNMPSMNTPLPQDTEMAQFMMKLAPRIRALEKNAYTVIGKHLERVLKRRMQVVNDGNGFGGAAKKEKENNHHGQNQNELLLLGHLFRSFALLGRGSDAESIFARVAVMPIVRNKVSIGKLDEGGSRGECAGLFGLLQEIVQGVHESWGDLLRSVESIFDMDGLEQQSEDDSPVQIDLVTAGVWVPIVTALMADPAIKTAIFSPGIASIFQANYCALDTFLAELAMALLKPSTGNVNGDASNNASLFGSDNDRLALAQLYYQPEIDARIIISVQSRIYCHPTTVDYSKKWNLPIYYQLRFGEVCARLEKAINGVQTEGWHAQVFTGPDSLAKSLKEKYGFELPVFMELFDALTWFWQPDVFLRPLTHRFLRGTIQLLGRVIAFVKDGLKGEIKFGLVTTADDTPSPQGSTTMTMEGTSLVPKPPMVDNSYTWCDRIEDVAAVSWELTVLESYITQDHVPRIVEVVSPPTTGTGTTEEATRTRSETTTLVSEVMTEAAQEISPVVIGIWNEIIVTIMTAKCSSPLSSVKGVAATYRMTNRPPPTQASPFVNTILRPLKEFDASFSNRIPAHLGILWKKRIVDTISESYSTAVSELIETVQKTEEALKNRKTRRAVAGGLSDGEKVRLQLYLDQKAFALSVEGVGIEPSSVEGIRSLISLTQAAEELLIQKA